MTLYRANRRVHEGVSRDSIVLIPQEVERGPEIHSIALWTPGDDAYL